MFITRLSIAASPLNAMMSVYIICFILLSGFFYVSCDDYGSGDDLHSTTFMAKIPVYMSELTNPISPGTSQLLSDYVDAVTKELGDHLTVSYNSITVSSVQFRNETEAWSLVQVEDTTLDRNALGKALQAITKDGAMGKFIVDEAQDLNECEEGLDKCSSDESCTNLFGTYECKCKPQYFEENGNGTVCVSPVTVTCSPKNMKVSVLKDYLDNLSIGTNDLHLNNDSCVGDLNGSSDLYEIIDNMVDCGNDIENNGSHVIYHNVLSNIPKKADLIFSGHSISIPFSCSFPINMTKSVKFEGEIPVITFTVESGKGLFDIAFELYEDSSFEVVEEDNKFKTTDTLHLQALLKSGDRHLHVVFEECWATPSNNHNDPTQYRIITDRCPSSNLRTGSVDIIINGEAEYARLGVKVFTFIDESTTYIHCNLAVCSGDSCKSDCHERDGRRKRSVLTSVSLARVRRESDGQIQEMSLGPLYRIGNTMQDHSGDTRFWAVTITLIVMISLLLAIVGLFIRKRSRRSSKEAVVTLSMRQFDDDDAGIQFRNDMTYCDDD